MPSCVARVPAMEIEHRVAEAVRVALSDSDRQRSGGSQVITRPRGGPGAAADPPSAAQPADPSDLRAASERRRSRRFPRETFDFLHDKSSVRPVDLQQALGFAVLQIFPLFKRTIRSKFRSVESRCAAAMTVRPCMRRESASRIASSASLSRADVASSKRRIGEFFRRLARSRRVGADRRTIERPGRPPWCRGPQAGSR